MSNQYSVGGYKIALLAKSKKTLLVEGRDDKEFFSRFKLREYESRTLDIDTADIFSGGEFTGLGAKAKIDKLLASDNSGSGLSDKLRVFVDREWEGLTDESTGEGVGWTPPVMGSIRYVTSGHSIENYSFVIDFVIHYLHHFGGQVATPSVCKAVSKLFPEAIFYAASFSEVARAAQCLTRCDNVFDVSDFCLIGDKVHALPSLTAKLQARGVNGAEILSRVERNYAGKWRDLRLATNAQMVCHGHLGECIIWNLVGLFAISAGVTLPQARELALGRKDERRRSWYTWLIESGAANCTSMKLVMDSA